LLKQDYFLQAEHLFKSPANAVKDCRLINILHEKYYLLFSEESSASGMHSSKLARHKDINADATHNVEQAMHDKIHLHSRQKIHKNSMTWHYKHAQSVIEAGKNKHRLN